MTPARLERASVEYYESGVAVECERIDERLAGFGIVLIAGGLAGLSIRVVALETAAHLGGELTIDDCE